MSTVELEVGKFAYNFPEYYLKLSSSYSIILVGDSSHSSASPCFVDLDGVGPRGLWVDETKGIHFILTLVMDEIVPDRLERRRLIESLGTFLRTIEIWSQLDFRVTLTLPATHEVCNGDQIERSGDVILSLMPIQRTLFLGSSVHGKECPHLVDTRPPQGMDSARLEKVIISLIFSRMQSYKYPIGKDARTKSFFGADAEEMLFLGDEGGLLEEGIYHSQPDVSLMSPWGHSIDRRSSSQPRYPSITSYIGKQEPTSFNDGTSLAPSSSQQSLTTSSSKMSGEEPSLGDEVNTSAPDISVLAHLVDVSLRTMIAGRTFISSGTKLVYNAAGRTLDNIAPVLFSPGYRQAVSSRACMINSIAQSIASVSQRSQGALLQSTISRLKTDEARYMPFSMDPDDSLDKAGDSGLLSWLKAHLWKLIQQQAFNPHAARVLKPTQFTPLDTSDADAQFDEMLGTPVLKAGAAEGVSIILGSQPSRAEEIILDEDNESIFGDYESDNYLLDDFEAEDFDECLEDIADRLFDCGGLGEDKSSKGGDNMMLDIETMLDEEAREQDDLNAMEIFWKDILDEDVMLDC